jgi:hypothetical protein
VEQCSDYYAGIDATQSTGHYSVRTYLMNGNCSGCPAWCTAGIGGQNETGGTWSLSWYSNNPLAALADCLRMMWAEGSVWNYQETPAQRAAAKADPTTFQSTGHYLNMSSPTHWGVSCGFSVNSSTFFATQDFLGTIS